MKKVLTLMLSVLLIVMPWTAAIAEEATLDQADLAPVTTSQSELAPPLPEDDQASETFLESSESESVILSVEEPATLEDVVNEVPEDPQLVINHVLDDNTLWIEGYAGTAIKVDLINDANQVIVSSETNRSGEFSLELPTTLAATQSYRLLSFSDIGLLNELTIVVEPVGIILSEVVTDKMLKLTGQTSPNRQLDLLDEAGIPLTVVYSNEEGVFEIDLLTPFKSDDIFELRVRDSQRIARSIQIKVEVGESELIPPTPTTPVFNTSTLIKGTADVNVEVTLLDEAGTLKNSVLTDEAGNFELVIEEDYPIGSVIWLRSQTEVITSSLTEVIIEAEPMQLAAIDLTNTEHLSIHQGVIIGQTTSLLGRINHPQTLFRYHIYLNNQRVLSPRTLSNFSFPFTSIEDLSKISVKKGYATDQEQNYQPVAKDIKLVLLHPIAVGDVQVKGYIIGLNEGESYQVRYERPRGPDLELRNLTSDTFTFNINTSQGHQVRIGDTIRMTVSDPQGNVLIPTFQIPVIDKVTTPISLAFNIPPSDIVFETIRVDNHQEQIVHRIEPEDYRIEVMDTRAQAASWRLTVQALNPLTNENGHELRNSLVFQGETQQSIEAGAVEVSTHEKSTVVATNPQVRMISWDADEGVLVKVNPFFAYPNTTYTTTLVWTLENVP